MRDKGDNGANFVINSIRESKYNAEDRHDIGKNYNRKGDDKITTKNYLGKKIEEIIMREMQS